LVVHVLIHMVFIFRLSAKRGTWATLLFVYCVFLGLHLLWFVAIRTQYCQRRYLLSVLVMAAPTGLLLYRLGIVAAVLPAFEVPMISVLSTLACMIDVATCWTF
jgi:hypothetical protein